MDDALIGEVVGRWRVVRLIGAGGMGRVYEAVQPEIGARVAIKVLRREAQDDRHAVERFFTEARAVNVARHENIVDIIDLARLADGTPYIVMEYLDGASLAALFRRGGGIALGALARIVGEVLAALEVAHAHGIVHRDLKPDNVFVSPSGRVKVLDFGIAKLVRDGGPTTTQTGMLLGTPAYMAPEQARSQPIDARTDLYAAGVILYEGATGAPPFAAANLFDLLKLHVEAAPAPPHDNNPALPEAFEAVIVRALAKDPAARFASAREMRDALARAAAGLPVPSLELTPPPRPLADPLGETAASTGQSPPPRRSRGKWIGAVLAAGALASGTWWLARTEPQPSPSPSPLPSSLPVPLPHAAAAQPLPSSAAAQPSPSPPPPPPPPPRPPPPPKPAFSPHADGTSTLALARSFDPLRNYALLRDAVATYAGAKVYPYMIRIGELDARGRFTGASDATFDFLSPTYTKRTGNCLLSVQVRPGLATLAPANFGGGACNERPIAAPHCAFAALLERAQHKGLDPSSTATVTLAHNYPEAWQFSAGSFSEVIDDDCP